MGGMSQSASMPKDSHLPNTELPIWPEPVQGSKLVANLQKYVAGLRTEPRHGNQSLFLDDVFLAYLLAFFNPTLRTLRVIEDFSQTKQAQKHLSITRICRSTLSDFNQLVDPSRLQLILAALRAELAQRTADGRQHASDLNAVLQQVKPGKLIERRLAAGIDRTVDRSIQHQG